MPVDAGYAALSDNLLVVTILAYAVAMLLYAVEYAFGNRGRVAVAASAPASREARVLVGAGGGPSTVAAGPDSVTPGVRRTRTVAFGRMAVFLTLVGWAAHLGCLTFRGLAVGRAPWGNMYEFAVAATLVAVTAYLVLLWRQPVRYLGAFVMVPVVLLLGLAGTVLYTRAAPLMPALQSYWLWIHVSMITLACGIFLVGFTTSVLYLVRARYERRVVASAPVRFPTSLGVRLPAADRLEQVTFRVIALGFPILTFAVIAGAIWAEAAWGRYWGWDPKETWAFITWVIYAAYLHARSTAGWRGRRAIGLALLGWAAMMFNLFGVNILISGLHSYAGLS
ncbi:MAG: c-type cytochrome biogenesis protein CcsB [Actinomycetota bacterium]|nr:c-type cytochrome biogenesis protein CcsB [Actinomycetota bacterium]